MQQVYNKTMAMLFSGTKNHFNHNAGFEMKEGEDENFQSKDRVLKLNTCFSLSNLSVTGQLQATVFKGSGSP